MLANAGPHGWRNVLEPSIPQIFVDQPWILESLTGGVAFNLRVHVAVNLEKILPAIIVVIEEAAAPRDVLIVDANSGGKRNIVESAVSIVVVEVASVVGKVCFENVEPAVAVVIGHAYAHSGLLVAILAIGAAGDHSYIRKCTVVIVVKKNARLRIDGYINIRPAVVVEIIGHGRNGIARARLQNPGFFGDVSKSSVAVVVIQEIGVSEKATRPAHRRNAFPLANGRFAWRWSFFGVEFDVVADEKIETAIAVIVEPSATGSPADLFFV